VDATRFDRLTATLAGGASRRGFIGAALAIAAAVEAGRPSDATARRRRCRKFVLAPSRDPDQKFRHVDDNLLVEVIKKGSRGRTETVWDDTDDNNVNFGGENFRIPAFKARVGDRLRVRAYNLGGPCELDELWLFCKGSRRGRRLSTGFERKESCPTDRPFFDETFRIKP